MAFDRPAVLEINEARLWHLSKLGLPLAGKNVLEVGAGVGMLTDFFAPLDCDVLSTDGRLENVEAMRHYFPHRRAEVLDLNGGDYSHLGHFDVVFCYGTLYHTADPLRVLAGLSVVCDGLLLLETQCWHVDDGQNHDWADNSALGDQSLDGRACRPARDWLWMTLRQLFPYVYAPLTQPDHPQFPLSWPASPADNTRAIFVASREALALPTLTTTLPREYARFSI